jgi:hypothetical protein
MLAHQTPTLRAARCAQRRAVRCLVPRISCVARPARVTQAARPQAQGENTIALAGLGILAPFVADISAAMATGGDFGILEGRTAALVHPAIMGGLFFASIYAGYLGWQWRRTRTIPEEIKALKAQLPKPAAEGEAPPPSPVDAQITALEQVWRVCIVEFIRAAACCGVNELGCYPQLASRKEPGLAHGVTVVVLACQRGSCLQEQAESLTELLYTRALMLWLESCPHHHPRALNPTD